MQLRDDFAKHISELHNPIDRPYTASIDKSLLENIEDVEHLNKEIANINPDYMTFLPSYFWYWYFCIGWVYFSAFWLGNYFLQDVGEIVFINGNFDLFDIILTFSWLLVFGTPFFLLFYQFIRKHLYRIQYYFLKKEQKLVYYYRPSLQFFKPFELKVVDYKDLISEIHTIKHNTAYTPLNLYIADPNTGEITHHIKPHDVSVDPHVHWAFIRTYMESPAENLPIDNKICQAYPIDTSKSLFACSDIVFRKNSLVNNTHSGSDTAIVLVISSLYALGYLFQGNHYQCVKRAILHPDVKKLLTRDGKDNPYPIQPITTEAQRTFQGKNWQVKFRWIVVILINISLFSWAVVAYNS